MFTLGRILFILALSSRILAVESDIQAGVRPPRVGYRDVLKSKLRFAEEKKLSVIEGAIIHAPPNWLFFTPELRAELSPPFWGDHAVAVSRSSNPKYADPLEPIVDFYTQLKSAGIELWIVPVPPRVAVYGNAITADLVEPRPNQQSHDKFYEILRTRGVTVIDLTPTFFAAAMKSSAVRGDVKSPLFCLTDSHWSGTGIQLAAETLAGEVEKRDWFQAQPEGRFRSQPMSVEITGDLALLLNEKNPVKEQVLLRQVRDFEDGKPKLVADDPDSPILLLGDSHTLVFHDPAMYAEGCGLADHLALQLQMRMDVIGVRGSGANAARLNWRRRENPLAGKKLVIWCFSMREFTENTDGWRVIPMTKK